MAKTEHDDQARLQAVQAGLPPDVHDEATLDAYAALKRPSGHTTTTHKAKSKAK